MVAIPELCRCIWSPSNIRVINPVTLKGVTQGSWKCPLLSFGLRDPCVE